jgi:hypothetical protein
MHRPELRCVPRTRCHRQKRIGTGRSPAARRAQRYPRSSRLGPACAGEPSWQRRWRLAGLGWPAVARHPGRAGSGAALAVPACPRGGREYLDDVGAARGECAEQSMSLEDPGVVDARVHVSCVACPADSADRPGELELAFASGLSPGREGTRAVDRDDRGPICHDKVNDLLARHAARECQDPAIIDDRGVGALPLSARIYAGP